MQRNKIPRQDLPKRLLRGMRAEHHGSRVQWTQAPPFFHCDEVAYGLVPSGSEPQPQHLPQLRRWGRRVLRLLHKGGPTVKIQTLGYIRSPRKVTRDHGCHNMFIMETDPCGGVAFVTVAAC